jgi:dUTP pyrophosphatase
MMIGDKEIRRLIKEYELITDYIDLETQLQPTGFDLTIVSIHEYKEKGMVDFDNKLRKIPKTKPLVPRFNYDTLEGYFWHLKPNICYKIFFNEVVNLRDIPYPISMLSGRRSSLMRNGCITGTGQWDYGYRGRGVSSLFVGNPHGLAIKNDARFHQCWFFPVEKISQIYEGQYLDEGLGGKN